jgi:ABC-type Fe3+/spermidine/putrescine transport system ATPase subunit
MSSAMIADSSDIAVSVRGVTKRFNEVTALDNISLDIKRGEFFSLLGPSGCGKTTLLRIIGGFEQPTGGDVRIAGRDVLADPPYRRRTNMIFQHLALFPHLSVAENIAFGLEMKKTARSVIESKTADMLKLVRLDGYGKRRIDELSGGQKQRVAIARALVNEPEVLLLDEPLGALDLQLRLQMHEELKRIHKAIRSTFILVTHDQGEAITLSDRIAVMDNGHVVQLGTPHQVYARPKNRFVARFVGHANFIDGTVSSVSGGQCTVSSDGVQFSGRCEQAVSAGAPVTGVLRYERVRVIATDSSEGYAAVVDDVTFLGSTYRVTMKLSNGATIIAELADESVATRLQPGAKVRAAWADDSLVVLQS